jgi:hypothetical protein
MNRPNYETVAGLRRVAPRGGDEREQQSLSGAQGANDPSSGTGSAEPASTGEGARAPSLFPAAHGSAHAVEIQNPRPTAESEGGGEREDL